MYVYTQHTTFQDYILYTRSPTYTVQDRPAFILYIYIYTLYIHIVLLVQIRDSLHMLMVWQTHPHRVIPVVPNARGGRSINNSQEPRRRTGFTYIEQQHSPHPEWGNQINAPPHIKCIQVYTYVPKACMHAPRRYDMREPTYIYSTCTYTPYILVYRQTSLHKLYIYIYIFPFSKRQQHK